MATENVRIQFLRGTTAENDIYAGRDGEITVDSDRKQIRLHDGTTQGGVVIGGVNNITTAGVNKTLESGEWCTVTSGGVTLTLPTTPKKGDQVRVSVNGFTDTVVLRNGNPIDGIDDDVTLNRGNVSVGFYFDGQSWRTF